MGCGNPRRSKVLCRGVLEGFLEEEVLELDLNKEQIYLEAEGRVMQWSSIASQAPWQVCPQSHHPQIPSDESLRLAHDLGCYFCDIYLSNGSAS